MDVAQGLVHVALSANRNLINRNLVEWNLMKQPESYQATLHALDSYMTVVSDSHCQSTLDAVYVYDSHYQSTLDAVYVYVVPCSEFPIVLSYPHYPHHARPPPPQIRFRAKRE